MLSYSFFAGTEVNGPGGLFSQEQLQVLQGHPIPAHVAIVMDGNRRWARNRNLPVIAGHYRGAHVLTQITRAACEIGINALTVYSFSTENWHRCQEEVDALMRLFQIYLRDQRESMCAEGVRLGTIGDLSRLPDFVQEEIRLSKEATAGCKKIDLVLAINYGGRDDLKRAFVSIVEQLEKGVLSKQEISEELIGQYLDTANWPDPDLLIRTSGEMRQSNFLLWQLCYSEFDYPGVLWPDFGHQDFLAAVRRWQTRKRRLGG